MVLARKKIIRPGMAGLGARHCAQIESLPLPPPSGRGDRLSNSAQVATFGLNTLLDFMLNGDEPFVEVISF